MDPHPVHEQALLHVDPFSFYLYTSVRVLEREERMPRSLAATDILSLTGTV